MIKMLRTLVNYKSVIVLTIYLPKLGAVIVHGEPSRCRYTVHTVGLLPLWINAVYDRAVIDIYVRKAYANAILG